MLGIYFGLFWVQCAAGIALEAHYQIIRSTDSTLADMALGIIKGNGAVGIGAAVNAIVVAISVERVMVLAQMLRKKQLEEGIEIGLEKGRKEGRTKGIEEGRTEGIEEERQQSNEKIIAWAKEKGIPIEELPIEHP